MNTDPLSTENNPAGTPELSNQSIGMERTRIDLSIAEQVKAYLDRTEHSFETGSDNYFARLALGEALAAYSEANYGIGAVVVLAHGDKIYEFRAQNAMISGLGVHDHAEARGLEDCLAFKQRVLENKQFTPAELIRVPLRDPDNTYARDLNESTARLKDGIHVFGTLEPCPMCSCMCISSGVASSTSNALDGDLIEHNGSTVSNGGATSIGDKIQLMPLVWQGIMERSGLTFDLLQSEHPELAALSMAIFTDTREEIDAHLSQRTS